MIGDYEFTQQEVMAYPFTVAHQNTMAINETYLAKMEGLYQSCGYADLVDKYLTFPAVGQYLPPQPLSYASLRRLKKLEKKKKNT